MNIIGHMLNIKKTNNLKGVNMKNLTLKQLEKILISLIKKLDTKESNIRVVEE